MKSTWKKPWSKTLKLKGRRIFTQVSTKRVNGVLSSAYAFQLLLQSPTSCVCIASTSDECYAHNMWNPHMELIYRERSGVSFALCQWNWSDQERALLPCCSCCVLLQRRRPRCCMTLHRAPLHMEFFSGTAPSPHLQHSPCCSHGLWSNLLLSAAYSLERQTTLQHWCRTAGNWMHRGVAYLSIISLALLRQQRGIMIEKTLKNSKVPVPLCSSPLCPWGRIMPPRSMADPVAWWPIIGVFEVVLWYALQLWLAFY